MKRRKTGLVLGCFRSLFNLMVLGVFFFFSSLFNCSWCFSSLFLVVLDTLGLG